MLKIYTGHISNVWTQTKQSVHAFMHYVVDHISTKKINMQIANVWIEKKQIKYDRWQQGQVSQMSLIFKAITAICTDKKDLWICSFMYLSIWILVSLHLLVSVY